MERRAHSVALVLGAGGAAGHAYHAGVLCALASVIGWDARDADLIVGTSAGSQVAALLRAGLSPHTIYAQITSDPRAFAGSTAVRTRWTMSRWPSSPAYLRAVLRRPWIARPGRLIAALLPETGRTNQPFCRAYARLFAGHWAERPLWITAVNLDNGEPVVFGRAGDPCTDVGTAVCCSSAVPGLVRPGHVGGARYVDGAVASPTHLDLLVAPGTEPPRLVLVISPLSHFAPLRLLLRAELKRLARRRVPTIVFEPGGNVSAAIGWNPFDPDLAPRIADAAYLEAVHRLEGPVADSLRAVFTHPDRGATAG